MILDLRPAPPSRAHAALLQEALAILLQAGETPLASRLDGAGIAEAAGRTLHARDPALWEALARDARPLGPQLDACLLDALEGTLTGSPGVCDPVLPDRPLPYRPEAAAPLGPWLERRVREIRAVDPNALRLADLRLRGAELRDAATSLGLGPQLTRSIGNALAAVVREAGPA